MKTDSRTFIKIFWSYILVIIIPVTILGFLTLAILFHNLAEDTKALNTKILEQCGNILDGEMEKILTLSYGAEKNEVIASFAAKYRDGSDSGAFDIVKVIDELNISKANNRICQDIGIYFKNNRLIVTNSTAYSPQEYYEKYFSGSEYSFEQWQEKISRRKNDNFFIPTTVSLDSEEKKTIIYCRNITYNNQFGDFTFFSRINTEDLISKLTFIENQNIEFTMLDSEENVILQTDGFENQLLLQEEKSDNPVEKRSKVMNLKYMYQLSARGLSGNVHRAMLIFILMLALTILVSFVLASLQAGKLRGIMRKIFDEINGLENDLDKQLKIAKEKTLWNLLHNMQVDEAELKRLETGYAENTGKFFNILALSLSYLDDINFYIQEIELAWSEINNIVMQRLNESRIDFEMLRIDIQTYIYVLCYEDESMVTKLRTLPSDIFDVYQFRIYAGVGEKTSALREINISYDGAMSALRYSLHEKDDETAYYCDMKNMEITKIYYTAEKEQLLIRSIRMGEESGVKKLLDEIYQMNFHNRHLAPGTLKRLINSITITIYKVLDTTYSADNDKYEKFGRVCQNLTRSDDLEESFRCLEEICCSLCKDSGKKTGKEPFKKQVIDYISQNYQDDMLTLETLAEHLDINYYYLSRLMKEHLGVSFVQYLTAFRLEKAKQLLDNTDETIEQIAKTTGFYRSDSLIRAFKKYYNITPSKYRRQGR